MSNPFFEKSSGVIQYIILWLGYVLMHTFAFSSLLPIPLEVVLTDGLIHALIFGSLGVLLWNVLKYGNFMALSFFQRILNHLALAFITLSLWLASGYGILNWIYDSAFASDFLSVLPVRSFIGLLIYVILIRSNKSKSFSVNTTVMPDEEAVPATQKVQPADILDRVAVKSGTKIHVVLVPEILYLQADGDYVQIVTPNGKYLKEQTMKYFEEHLPENLFVRIHRSTIVNVEMISRIELYEKQNQLLSLKNGDKLKTSPGGYKALRTRLNL